MSIKEIGNQQNDSVEVREDSSGDNPKHKGKKCSPKRKFILEGVLGFSFGLLSRFLSVETLLFLLMEQQSFLYRLS